MRISSIRLQNNTNKRNSNPTFKAHPDFDKLAQEYNILASSFFRRGPFYGSPNEKFIDIVKLFKNIFSKNQKQKMLIAGIGESQEPFSYLATLKSLFKDKNLTDILDLKTIDLQSKPTKKQLFKNSYFEFIYEPDFAKSSFVKDIRENIRYIGSKSHYRVNDEIFEFLNNTYKQKSLWNIRLQEAIKTIPDNEFDIISINNTIGYIGDKDTRINTMKNVHRTLKSGGTFITDPYHKFLEEANLTDKFIAKDDGIFEKLHL